MADDDLFVGALEVAVFLSVGDSVLSEPRITMISWSHAHYFVDLRPMVIRIYSYFFGATEDNIV